MVKSPKKAKKAKKEETHEIETIAKNAGLRMNVGVTPSGGVACTDCSRPVKKTIEELRGLYNYMHGKDVPEEKKENRKWLELKCL